MLKKIILTLIVLLAAAIGIMFYQLNPIVQKFSTEFLSATLKTPVKIKQVDIKPFDLKISVQAIEIQNIGKFSGGDILQVSEIIVDANSLSGELIRLKTISLDGLLFNVEQQGKNVNLYDWYKSMKSSTDKAADSSTDTPSGAKSQTKVIVDSLTISHVVINVKTDKFERMLKLPNIEISNFGQAEGGILVDQLPKAILGIINKKIKKLINKELKSSILKKAKDALEAQKAKAKKLLQEKFNTDKIAQQLKAQKDKLKAKLNQEKIQQKIKEQKDKLQDKLKSLF